MKKKRFYKNYGQQQNRIVRNIFSVLNILFALIKLAVVIGRINKKSFIFKQI